ncbi:MAG: 3-isopropylmalate dehydratase [Deltaproteobacteria bacterium]|nr:3-isopropylmalate dehydratase [Deltaproteobacteria bacterium]
MSEPSRRTSVTLTGRVLYLTDDAAELEAQLQGRVLAFDPGRALLNNVSTDEITPGWVYHYGASLGQDCLVGLRSGVVKPGSIAAGGFEVLVAARSMGCGSSREQAPYSMLMAGVRVVAARSIEKIFRQNAENIGLLTTTDTAIVQSLERGAQVAIEAFTRGLDPISASIVEWGGLFAYNSERMAGRLVPPSVTTSARPMTLCEKIIAAHAVRNASTQEIGVSWVKPGDALFVSCDVRFSHEYVTPMASALLAGALGEDASIARPETVFTFRDHLTLLDQVIPEAHVRAGFQEQARSLARVQEGFASKHHLRLYGEVQRDGKAAGSEAICHNKVIESIATPGQVVIGTDSHTCMAGAIGCFAFGVGATDMAAAWTTADVRMSVPESVRIELHGRLREGVSAKDLMLHLLALRIFKSGDVIGKVIEFAGDGLEVLSLDERATLANMSVEAGGFTGIMEADEVVVQELASMRGVDAGQLRKRIVRADPDAIYAARIGVELPGIEPMVALPGDPRNGVPLWGLEPVKIDIAYGGSCTGGKRADMDMYAEVLSRALAKGKRVADGVSLFIQFGSQSIRRYAERKGYIHVFEKVGAQLVEPSCGACIGAGPGVSVSADQVTVSAMNRNFPGRSGPGKVYLASPYVVAASAIIGRITTPDEI